MRIALERRYAPESTEARRLDVQVPTCSGEHDDRRSRCRRNQWYDETLAEKKF